MSQTEDDTRNFPQEEIHKAEFHLTSFCTMWKWTKIAEFSPLPNITITKHNLSEGSRYLQYVNILMSWVEVNKTLCWHSL